MAKLFSLHSLEEKYCFCGWLIGNSLEAQHRAFFQCAGYILRAEMPQYELGIHLSWRGNTMYVHILNTEMSAVFLFETSTSHRQRFILESLHWLPLEQAITCQLISQSNQISVGNLLNPICCSHGIFNHPELRGDFLSSRKWHNQITKMPNAAARSLPARASPSSWDFSAGLFQHFQFMTTALPTVPCGGFSGSAFSLLMLQDNLGEFPTPRAGLWGILAEESKVPAPSLFGWHEGPVQSGSLKGCCKVVITGKVQLVSLWNTKGWCSGEHQSFWCLAGFAPAHLEAWTPCWTRPCSCLYKKPAGCTSLTKATLLPQLASNCTLFPFFGGGFIHFLFTHLQRRSSLAPQTLLLL